MRLENGANLVGDRAGDRPVGLLLPLDDAWPVRLAAADRLYRQLIERDADPPITPHRRESTKRALRTIDGRQSRGRPAHSRPRLHAWPRTAE